ncbi:class I SAM-dependent methyltransferase [Streptomyces sp. MSC1_001]|uniref:class I SAM-dependent methyltransferase n=1 Tax=Streptomyces sp. MSC1_001 TaxID=2909263 RepID=UPI0035B2B4EB
MTAATAWRADPYADALRTGHGPLFLRRDDGWLLPLEVERWCEAPDRADRSVLDRCHGTVLDIGCGPGRLVAALAAEGRRALGIDISPEAVAHTLRHGGAALCRSVFDPLPGEGRWDTALLIDGNPRVLLVRPAGRRPGRAGRPMGVAGRPPRRGGGLSRGPRGGLRSRDRRVRDGRGGGMRGRDAAARGRSDTTPFWTSRASTRTWTPRPAGMSPESGHFPSVM